MVFFQETPVLAASGQTAMFALGTTSAADTGQAGVATAQVPPGGDNASLIATQNFQQRNALFTATLEEGRTSFLDALAGRMVATVTQELIDLTSVGKLA